MTSRFWVHKSLHEMTDSEWESLCDGCGKCCLQKFIDDETNEIYYTRIACVMLDENTCNCKDYANRFKHVDDCLKLSRELVDQFYWLPETCSYRLLSEGKSLPKWHPLITGSKKAMHQGGFSAKDTMAHVANLDDWEDYIIFQCPVDSNDL